MYIIDGMDVEEKEVVKKIRIIFGHNFESSDIVQRTV